MKKTMQSDSTAFEGYCFNTFLKIMLLLLKDTVFFWLLFLSDSVTVKTDT